MCHIQHIARRFPIQASEDQLQLPPAPFSRRASGAVSALPPNIAASTAARIVLSPRILNARPNQHPAPNRAHNSAFLLLRTSKMNRRTNPTPRNHTARQSAQRSASPLTAPFPFSACSPFASSKRFPSNQSHIAPFPRTSPADSPAKPTKKTASTAACIVLSPRNRKARPGPGAHHHNEKSIHLPPRPARPAPQKPPPATYYGSNPLRAPIDPARFV